MIKFKKPFLVTFEIKKPFLVSLLICIVYAFLSLLPLPGFDVSVLQSSMHPGPGDIDWKHFSVMGIGIVGYIGAFFLVAMASLFLPPLIRLRKKGFPGWLRLEQISVPLLAIVVMIWSFFIATYFWSLGNDFPGFVRVADVLTFRIMVSLTLIGGCVVSIWFVKISRVGGFGHGVSLMVLVGVIMTRAWYLPQESRFDRHVLDGESKVLLAVVILGVIAGMVWLLSHGQVTHIEGSQDDQPRTLLLNFLPAGIIAWRLLVFFKDLDATFMAGFNGFGDPWFQSAFLLALSLLLGWLFNRFHWPSRRTLGQVKLLKNPIFWQSQAIGYIAVWVLAIGLPLFLDWKHLGMDLDFIVLFVVVAIVMDLFWEGRFLLKHSEITMVAVFQQVIHADGAAALLTEKGIPFAIRARNHRALLHFFGFYLEMTLLVPSSRALEAKAIIDTHFPWAPYFGIEKNA